MAMLWMWAIGLHVPLAIVFAVHAIRSRQPLYWLLILFMLPWLGSVAYYLGVYRVRERSDCAPGSRTGRQGGAPPAPDAARAVRDAHEALSFAPTAHNQMRLANAQLEAGEAEDAAATYEHCLLGAFANDPLVRLGAARASLACGRHAEALVHLERLRGADATFRPEQTSLLMARALAGAGRTAEARAGFEAAVERHGSFEAKAEYAIWAADASEFQLAHRLQNDLQSTMDRWNRHTHTMNLPLIRRIEAAFAHVPRQQ